MTTKYLTLASQSLIGTKIYNNGISEARFADHPDDPQWKLGRLPRSEEHASNQTSAARAACIDHIFINDGTKTIKIHKDEPIPDGYSLGMAKKAKITFHDILHEYVPCQYASLGNAELHATIMGEVGAVPGGNNGAKFKISYLMKNHKDAMLEVYHRTRSVPYEFTVQQRLMLLRHDTDQQTHCVVCGKTIVPNTDNERLSIVCSSKCYQQARHLIPMIQ